MAKKNGRVLFIVLVFGITVVGCRVNKLDGTWIGEGNVEGVEIKYNNGNYEVSYSIIGFYTGLVSKGIYTIKGDEITQTLTHYNGNSLNRRSSSTKFDESRWYTKEEILSKGENYDSNFKPYSIKYSINGNTVTFTYDDGETEIYTKKQKETSQKNAGKGSEKSHRIVGTWVNDTYTYVFNADGSGTCFDGSSTLVFKYSLTVSDGITMEGNGPREAVNAYGQIAFSPDGKTLTLLTNGISRGSYKKK